MKIILPSGRKSMAHGTSRFFAMTVSFGVVEICAFPLNVCFISLDNTASRVIARMILTTLKSAKLILLGTLIFFDFIFSLKQMIPTFVTSTIPVGINLPAGRELRVKDGGAL